MSRPSLRIPTLLIVAVGVLAHARIANAQYETEVIDGFEWTTNRDYPLVGDPEAKKGGELRIMISTYLPTLRKDGPSSNLTTITDIYGLTHEQLLGIHPEVMEWVPSLASHWWVSPDKMQFKFRIDPRARFSNGKEVTADDVVASFEHLVDPDIKDPASTKLMLDYYEMPVAESKYVVSVKAKRLSWRSMLYFSASMPIYPADEIRIPGDIYLRDYNWKPVAGTGPYIIADPERDLKKDVSITLTRREDYWAQDDPLNRHTANFDRLRFVVVRDRTIAFEMLKKGELDYLLVQRAQRWVEECNFTPAAMGWVQKRKVYNEQPQSFSGYMFNMREWPFDEKNVRLAFCYAFNREVLFDKLFFNEYEYIDSYYPGSEWGNPKNRRIRFNPGRANRLLDRAGYTKRNEEGVRVHEKTGRALQFTLEFGVPSYERIHRVVRDYLREVGIKMDLKKVDYNALVRRIGERKFKLHFQSWRGILFPNPITSWHGDLAAKTDNNNLTGFADPRVDELMVEYDKTFDHTRQVEIIREIDSILFKSYTTALAWFAPFERYVYWNRYGMPDTVLTRRTDQRAIWSYWWFDPQRDAKLRAAMAAGEPLPKGETIVDPWGVKARMEAKPESAAAPGNTQ